MSETMRHYTAQFKLNVIAVAKETGKNLATARCFGASDVNVCRWLRNASSLAACSSSQKAFTGPQWGRHAELEEDLARYVNEVRNKYVAVTVEMIQMKARELARKHGISLAIFKASKGWVKRFMKRLRFSLRRRTSVCQRCSEDFEEK